MRSQEQEAIIIEKIVKEIKTHERNVWEGKCEELCKKHMTSKGRVEKILGLPFTEGQKRVQKQEGK